MTVSEKKIQTLRDISVPQDAYQTFLAQKLWTHQAQGFQVSLDSLPANLKAVEADRQSALFDDLDYQAAD